MLSEAQLFGGPAAAAPLPGDIKCAMKYGGNGNTTCGLVRGEEEEGCDEP